MHQELTRTPTHCWRFHFQPQRTISSCTLSWDLDLAFDYSQTTIAVQHVDQRVDTSDLFASSLVRILQPKQTLIFIIKLSLSLFKRGKARFSFTFLTSTSILSELVTLLPNNRPAILSEYDVNWSVTHIHWSVNGRLPTVIICLV